ncbi:hypothetical protein BE11_16375 [Sorangium cellulosum]|nr:hypothetical protein BE11_16375 [Sorangium cellulosum]
MTELFRFSLVRPGKSSAPVSVDLSERTTFQGELFRPNATVASREDAARAFRDSRAFLRDIGDLAHVEQLRRLIATFTCASPPVGSGAIQAMLLDVLGPGRFERVHEDRRRLVDTFLAAFIAPAATGPRLTEIADFLRVIEIARIAHAQRNDLLDDPSFLATMMNAPIQIPAALSQLASPQLEPVGFADLLVVKEQIREYRRGEIARIENVLRGETRDHVRKHNVTTERESVFETERSREESEERASSERAELQQEVQKSLKETFNVKAGLEVGYGKTDSSFFVRANAGFTYDRIEEESSKLATELAREVTTKAATRIAERVKTIERRRVVEQFEDMERQAFENKGTPPSNISGVYQFLDKVYEAQVFNYGGRFLIDLVLPDPGAYLRALRDHVATTAPGEEPFLTHNGRSPSLIGPERGLELDPSNVSDVPSDPHYYGKYAARLGVTGLEPPPQREIFITRSYSFKSEGEEPTLKSETFEIPNGYELVHVYGLGMWGGDAKSSISVFIGGETYGAQLVFQEVENPPGSNEFTRNGGASQALDLPLTTWGAIAIRGEGSMQKVAFNVVMRCELVDQALVAWKQQAFDRILARFVQLRQDYDDKRAAAARATPTTVRLGRNPAANRTLERLELKKSIIARLTNETVKGSTGLIEPTPQGKLEHLPGLNVPAATADVDDFAAKVRFFEQAFEWENLSYVLYPYFWGDATQWARGLAHEEDDPLFENFLRAGAARVVVAVRPGFIEDVLYYLHMRKVWMGGPLPLFGDPRYLPIVDEIRALTGAPGGEKPYSDETWDIVVPTELIRLRDDDRLPTWERQGAAWKWKDL